MTHATLPRTIRRCTAVLVLVISLGADELAEYGFTSLLLFAGPAGAYLFVSVLFGAFLRFEDLAEPVEGVDETTGSDEEDDGTTERGTENYPDSSRGDDGPSSDDHGPAGGGEA